VAPAETVTVILMAVFLASCIRLGKYEPTCREAPGTAEGQADEHARPLETRKEFCVDVEIPFR